MRTRRRGQAGRVVFVDLLQPSAHGFPLPERPVRWREAHCRMHGLEYRARVGKLVVCVPAADGPRAVHQPGGLHVLTCTAPTLTEARTEAVTAAVRLGALE